MSVLSDNTLHDLARDGLVSPYNPAHVSPCSIDLTLGKEIQIECLDDKMGPWLSIDITDPYRLRPGQFVLAHSMQTVFIPDDCAGQVALRSSAARMGLDHALSGWIDSGFCGEITFELKNQLQLHDIELKAGMRLLQLIIFKLDAPPARPYGMVGNYQNQTGATISNLNF